MWQRRIIQTQEEYRDKIFAYITNNKPIVFGINDKAILKSYYVAQDDTLNKSLKKDKDAFIDRYFIDNKLKSEDISFTKEKAIIYYLFNNGTYCKRDDISGSIFIRVPPALTDVP